MGLSFFVIVLLLFNVIISRKGFKDPVFFNRYMLQVRPIQQGQYYRLWTSSFLHVDSSHLLFNMMTLYFFGDYVVSYFGGLSFWLLYLVSVTTGSLFGIAFNSEEPNYTAVGASGGVIGVLFSAILAYPQLQLGLFFIPIPIPGYVFVVLYIAYTLYGMKRKNDSIGHSAHLGGAVGGVLLSWFLNPHLISNWIAQLPF